MANLKQKKPKKIPKNSKKFQKQKKFLPKKIPKNQKKISKKKIPCRKKFHMNETDQRKFSRPPCGSRQSTDKNTIQEYWYTFLFRKGPTPHTHSLPRTLRPH